MTLGIASSTASQSYQQLDLYSQENSDVQVHGDDVLFAQSVAEEAHPLQGALSILGAGLGWAGQAAWQGVHSAAGLVQQAISNVTGADAQSAEQTSFTIQPLSGVDFSSAQVDSLQPVPPQSIVTNAAPAGNNIVKFNRTPTAERQAEREQLSQRLSAPANQQNIRSCEIDAFEWPAQLSGVAEDDIRQFTVTGEAKTNGVVDNSARLEMHTQWVLPRGYPEITFAKEIPPMMRSDGLSFTESMQAGLTYRGRMFPGAAAPIAAQSQSMQFLGSDVYKAADENNVYGGKAVSIEVFAPSSNNVVMSPSVEIDLECKWANETLKAKGLQIFPPEP